MTIFHGTYTWDNFVPKYPHLLYCSAVWGGAYRTILNINLFISQKRKVLRVMYSKSKYDHTDPLFYDNKLLKVPDIISLQTCVFVFKCLHTYPNNKTFELLSNNPNILWHPNDLRVPLCRTVQEAQLRSVSVRGVRVQNTLTHHTNKSGTSVLALKHSVKSKTF